MENKTDKNQAKTENKESLVLDSSKKDQAQIIKFSLVVLWVVALIFGIGFKIWFLFFIALFLTIAYLSGGKIKGCDGDNHRKIGPDLVNDPAYKSISGNVWSGNDRSR
ncbi:MAG: hypothetical protein ACJA0S_001191 [Rickettsiales bacterium]|jgi:hypothetical protein